MDKVIYGPTIYTLNEQNDTVEAVGLEDGKIKVLGSKEKVSSKSGAETEEINPSSDSMFPGFVDSHVHFLDRGLEELFYLDLSRVSSKKELLEEIRKEAEKKRRDEWVLGSGWDESKWEDEEEFPTKEELDEIVSGKPVAIQRVDMHTFVLNSRGIDELEIDPSTKGARRIGGEFTGIFSEDASLEVKKAIAPDKEDTVQALRKSIKEAHRKGVTSVHQMVVDPGEFRRYFCAYQELWKEDDLDVRVRIYFTGNYVSDLLDLGMGSGFGDDKLEIGGLKVFADGAIGSKTAWVDRPYQGEPDNFGLSIMERDKLGELVEKADRNGIQVAVHAIGDRAMDQVVGCLEEVISGRDNPLRHRIEHCEMARDEQIEKMSKLGIIACMQPNFVGEWGLSGSMYEERFGPEKLSELDRFRVFQDSGVPLAFGSDGMPFDPLYGIHWAVNSPFDTQRMEPRSALKAYTLGSAFAGGVEGKVGSIEKGKYADFVLLDGDPIENPEGIKGTDVDMTILEGEIVYE